jgi:hypothetical protein
MLTACILLGMLVLGMAIRHKISGQAENDRISLVKIEDVMDHLENAKPETISQLYDFGKLILVQAGSLRQWHDVKLTNCLGWSSAIFVVVLLGKITGLIAYIGGIAALGAIVLAGFGLLSFGGWKWPGETNWFSWDFFETPDRLKGQHLIALVDAHQSYAQKVQTKGRLLFAAQIFLVAAGILVGIAALASPATK